MIITLPQILTLALQCFQLGLWIYLLIRVRRSRKLFEELTTQLKKHAQLGVVPRHLSDEEILGAIKGELP